MFSGEFHHSLDAKGRLVLPAEIRSLTEEGAWITKSMVGPYLIGFTAADWLDLAARMKEQSAKDPERRAVERRFFASALQATPDRAGRILIPQGLREHARLENDVLIAGVNEVFEIWNPALYEASERRTDVLIPQMLPKLPELNY